MPPTWSPAALLIVQRIWVTGLVSRLRKAWRCRPPASGIYSLDDVQQLAGRGNKAYRLAQMRAAGLPVPNGFLLTPSISQRVRGRISFRTHGVPQSPPATSGERPFCSAQLRERRR